MCRITADKGVRTLIVHFNLLNLLLKKPLRVIKCLSFLFSMQNYKKPHKKYPQQSEKKTVEGATLKLVSEIQLFFVPIYS